MMTIKTRTLQKLILLYLESPVTLPPAVLPLYVIQHILGLSRRAAHDYRETIRVLEEAQMKVSKIYPRRYLNGEVIPRTILTITAAQVVSVRPGGGPPQDKLALSFRECQKQLLLSPTNAWTLARAFGEETETWTGKRIVLFTKQSRVAGREVNIPIVQPLKEEA